MAELDFSLAQVPNFGGILGAAFQAGSALGQERRKREALDLYARDPANPAAESALISAAPEIGLKVRAARVEQESRAQIGELVRKARAGDKGAADALYGLDFDVADKLNDSHLKTLQDGTKAVGDAAVRIALAPPGERAALWNQSIDFLSETYPDLAKYKDRYSDQTLNGVLAQAGRTDDVRKAQMPDLYAGQPGAPVYDQNPNSPSFSLGGGVPRGVGASVPAAAVQYLRQNPGMAEAFDQKYGAGASRQYLGGAPSQGGASFPVE